LIELGVPFSDPMADGPANQRALARGLGAGASLAAILSMVSELRAQTQIPIILFGYFNPIFHYGCERLCADAARAGIDGILTVDLPPEEAGELKRPARANGLDIIYLLAPTTPLDRSRAIARSASGFLYYVSVTGVTGARAHLDAGIAEHMRELRSVTDLPIGVGFGISTPAQAAEVATMADAVVVGSDRSAHQVRRRARGGGRTGRRNERCDEGGARRRARARIGGLRWLNANRRSPRRRRPPTTSGRSARRARRWRSAKKWNAI
jgi:tryptophan synthase alpha chain